MISDLENYQMIRNLEDMLTFETVNKLTMSEIVSLRLAGVVFVLFFLKESSLLWEIKLSPSQ